MNPAPTASTGPSQQQPTPALRYYVPLPSSLILDLRDTPVAIGVYALIGRLTQIRGVPVPLSPRDLTLFDPSLRYGAAARALRRLVAAGYLTTHAAGGRKQAYLPTWGLVRGQPVPWDRAAPGWGRPRHRPATRLPQELLDVFLGRLEPHSSHPARITRYLTTPLIGLRDVGTYASALEQLPAESATLAALGLLTPDGVQPVPPTMSILAWASQHALHSDNALIHPEGWARTAFADPTPAGSEAAGTAMLFFVPRERVAQVIGQEIGGQIGSKGTNEPANSASDRGIPPHPEATHGSHGSEESDRIDPPTGGGRDRVSSPQRHTIAAPSPTAASIPLTESAQLLMTAQLNPRVVAELADAPVALVQEAFQLARSTPGVRDPARWVVGVLRARKAQGWATPPPTPAEPPKRISDTPIVLHPRVNPQERARWLRRFRNAEPHDRPAVLARFFAEYPLEESYDHAA